MNFKKRNIPIYECLDKIDSIDLEDKILITKIGESEFLGAYKYNSKELTELFNVSKNTIKNKLRKLVNMELLDLDRISENNVLIPYYSINKSHDVFLNEISLHIGILGQDKEQPNMYVQNLEDNLKSEAVSNSDSNQDW